MSVTSASQASRVTFEASRGAYVISTDPALLNVAAIHEYLTNSYWAAGRTLATVQRSLQHSLCFGLYQVDKFQEMRQIGFARVVTDYTLSAHLCDVYILEAHRGQGLGKWLITCVLDHPELSTVGKWTLATNDAHGFYAPYGFRALSNPASLMEFVRKPS